MKRLFRLSLGDRGRRKDVASEIDFHIDMRMRELIAAGVAPDRARAEAVAAFGNVEAIEAACRDEQRRIARTGSWREQFDDIQRDIKYAARSLLRAPGFTATALLTLTLGIGANSAIFSLVNGVLLRGLPYANADQLLVIQHPSVAAAAPDIGFSALEIADFRAQLPSVQALGEYHSMSFDLLGHGDPRRVQTGVVSANFFQVLGVKPYLGRAFVRGEDAIGAAPVLMLSYEFWVDQLGSDSSIVGKTFTMNDRQHVVVGVLPPLPAYPNRNDVWMPTSSCPFMSAPRARSDRTARMSGMIAQVRSGATPEQVQRELAGVENRLHTAYPDAYKGVSDATVRSAPIHSEMTQQARPAFFVLLGIAGLVLLVACINVAHLTLARQLRRQREFAIRTALGAGRQRLVRQILTESLLLSVVGGALGLFVARIGMAPLTAFAAKITARADGVVLDWRVALFTLGIAIIAGVFFGVVPVVSQKSDVVTQLRDGSATAAASRVRLRSALVVGEVALAFVVLVGAGLMIRSFARMMTTAPGYDPQNVITARVDLNFTKYATRTPIRQFAEQVSARLEATPGVTAVAVANAFPSSSSQPQNLAPFQIRGQDSGDSLRRPKAEVNMISSGYFKTVGVPILAGRAFSFVDRDTTAALNAIVSSSLVRRYFPSVDPIGKQISFDGERWATIVGVAGDVRQFGPAADVPEQVYLPFDLVVRRDIRVLIRQTNNATTGANLLRRTIAEIDPLQPVIEIQTLEDARRDVIATPRQITVLLSSFAALALAIATAGLGGVIAYSVGQRTAEFGIRMALGAERASIFRIVITYGVRLVLVGIAIGVVASLLFGASITTLLTGIPRTDPVTYAGVALTFIGVAVLACAIPARRATAINPVSAFRAN